MDVVTKRCDRCKAKDAEPFMTVRQVGGQDACIDLCSGCCALLLRRVMAAITPALQAKITRELLAYRKES